MRPKTVCSKCNKETELELVHESVVGSSIQVSIIRCMDCCTAIGVLEFDATIDMLKPIHKKIDALDKKVEDLLSRRPS